MFRNISKKNLIISVILILLFIVGFVIFLFSIKKPVINTPPSQNEADKEQLIVERLNIVGNKNEYTKKEEQAVFKELEDKSANVKQFSNQEKEDIIKMLNK